MDASEIGTGRRARIAATKANGISTNKVVTTRRWRWRNGRIIA
jgi:hypothetical protein